jgi:hypothetical protein
LVHLVDRSVLLLDLLLREKLDLPDREECDAQRSNGDNS